MTFRRLSVAAACAFLALASAAAFPVVGYAAYVRFGEAGMIAAAIAIGVCWISATLALMITGGTRNSALELTGILVANGVRFGVPLLAGATLHWGHTSLAEVGIFGWFVIAYLWTLLVGTTLSVFLERKQNHGDGKGIVTNG
jgi:acyl dehydratase